MPDIFWIAIFAFLGAVIATFIVSLIIEIWHFFSLKRREKNCKNVLVVCEGKSLKDPSIHEARLLNSEVVLAINFFKRLAYKVRNLFGGQSAGLQKLLERARREVVLRLKEQSENASAIVDVRITSTNIATGKVQAMAQGTAIYIKKGSKGPFKFK